MTIPYDAIRAFRSRHVFNPWAQRDPLDAAASRTCETGPRGRLARIRAHFDVSPALVLVGEASGYQGCHFSGIPFTNEKLLLDGRIPRVPALGRLSKRARPWCEPSATIVWGALHALGLAERTVLWNAFAWHPFKPGQPYSNRVPTRGELEAGLNVLDRVLGTFGGATVVAVGKVAERALRELRRDADVTVRHPAMGGADEFRSGLAAVAAHLDRATGRKGEHAGRSGPERR